MMGSDDQKVQLKQLFKTSEAFSTEDKISAVKDLFLATGAAEASQKLMQNYTQKAFNTLESLSLNQEASTVLIDFANQLMQRKF